jgi:hypothetical protein
VPRQPTGRKVGGPRFSAGVTFPPPGAQHLAGPSSGAAFHATPRESRDSLGQAGGAAVCGRKGDRGRRIHDREHNRQDYHRAACGSRPSLRLLCNERAPSKTVVRRSSADRQTGTFATFLFPESGSQLCRARGQEGRNDRLTALVAIRVFLPERFAAQIVSFQKSRLMNIHRALFPFLPSQAVGWLIARLFRHRTLISIGKKRRASSLPNETLHLRRQFSKSR